MFRHFDGLTHDLQPDNKIARALNLTQILVDAQFRVGRLHQLEYRVKLRLEIHALFAAEGASAHLCSYLVTGLEGDSTPTFVN